VLLIWTSMLLADLAVRALKLSARVKPRRIPERCGVFERRPSKAAEEAVRLQQEWERTHA